MKEDEDNYIEDEPSIFVNGNESEGIYSRVILKDLEDFDPISREKAREILEPRGFEIINYELIIRDLAKEAGRKGRKAVEAFLEKYGIESEYGIKVPDLMFKCKGWWGYLELETLTDAWDLDKGEHKYPYNVRYPNRKYHLSKNPKYEGILWYCQFCYDDMNLHHIFSGETMRRAEIQLRETKRNPGEKEGFRVIPKGLYYENGLFSWSPDKAYDLRGEDLIWDSNLNKYVLLS